MSIHFKEVSHTYNENTPFSYAALKGVDLTIPQGRVTAIIGETGSGKSTLVQHLNALLLPTGGEIEILGKVIQAKVKPKNVKALRKQVGLVFQFPEYQLFEETIIRDVSFGPKNFGVPEAEANKIAAEMLELVGLDKSYLERSPFELSGGQKRRVAIAGIMAMDPGVLVLDEPTAGLDPQGAKEMMTLFLRMNREFNKTVLIVSHDMEHVLNYCDDVIVMRDGKVFKHCSVEQFFETTKLLDELKINPPAVIALREKLNQNGYHIGSHVVTIEALAEAIAKEVKQYE